MELGHVHPEARAGDQADRVAIDNQMRRVQGRTERGERPAQGRARMFVVVFRPQQRGQRLAGVAATGNRQVGQQGGRLARVNRDRRTVARDAGRAQEMESELGHGFSLLFSQIIPQERE